MGEAKRRKQLDPNYGKPIKGVSILCYGGIKGCVHFARYEGLTWGIEHGGGKFMFKPCKQCSQYDKYPEIMAAALNDLENEPEGLWVFGEATGLKWLRKPLDGMLKLHMSLYLHSAKAVAID